MKIVNCLAIISLSVLASSLPLQAGYRGEPTRATPQEKPVTSEQIMVANFFNILVNGAIAVSSKGDPEKQLQATAEVLNSIANLAQLAMRKSSVIRRTNPDTTARDIYNSLMQDKEFMNELNKQREAIYIALLAAVEQKNLANKNVSN